VRRARAAAPAAVTGNCGASAGINPNTDDSQVDATGITPGVNMSNPLQSPSIAVVLSLSCALGGCVDLVDDTAADTAVAEQAIYHNEVRLQRIEASVLEEGGDEIYLTASQSSGGSVNIIRPPQIPDYWRFDYPGKYYTLIDQHVGTIIPGSLLIIYMREQDAGEHDKIGTISFELDHNLEPKVNNTPTGYFVAMENGKFAVRFTNGARYKAWFEVGP
jgi:hypothetical protein